MRVPPLLPALLTISMLGCDSGPGGSDATLDMPLPDVAAGDLGLDVHLPDEAGDLQAPDTSTDAALDPTGTKWVSTAGGGEVDLVYDLVLDKQDNAYLTGRFQGTAIFGTHKVVSKGGYDGFVAKLDSAGTFKWAVAAGGAGFDCGYGLAVGANGNVVAVGRLMSSTASFGTSSVSCSKAGCPFIWTLNSGGTTAAIKVVSAIEGGMEAVAVDAAGNRYVTGWFNGSGSLGSQSLSSHGDQDMFVAKTDASSSFIWATSGGGAAADGGYEVEITQAGKIFHTGWFYGAAAFGGFTLAGGSYLAELGAKGKVLWVKNLAPTAIWGELESGPKGNLFVGGHFKGSASFGSSTLTSYGADDSYVASFTPSGTARWGTSGGGPGIDTGYGLAVDKQANAYLTGCFKTKATFGTHILTGKGSNDVYVASVDVSGKVSSALAATGAGNNSGWAVAVDSKGALLVAGMFDATLTCGSRNVSSSAGSTDIFVWKLKPE